MGLKVGGGGGGHKHTIAPPSQKSGGGTCPPCLPASYASDIYIYIRSDQIKYDKIGLYDGKDNEGD